MATFKILSRFATRVYSNSLINYLKYIFFADLDVVGVHFIYKRFMTFNRPCGHVVMWAHLYIRNVYNYFRRYITSVYTNNTTKCNKLIHFINCTSQQSQILPSSLLF